MRLDCDAANYAGNAGSAVSGSTTESRIFPTADGDWHGGPQPVPNYLRNLRLCFVYERIDDAKGRFEDSVEKRLGSVEDLRICCVR